MNDVIDALVGDMPEEYGDDYIMEEINSNQWLIDGQYSFSEFLIKMNLEDIDVYESFNTIGGYIIKELEAIPEIGTTVELRQYKLKVVAMDGPRIDKIQVINFSRED